MAGSKDPVQTSHTKSQSIICKEYPESQSNLFLSSSSARYVTGSAPITEPKGIHHHHHIVNHDHNWQKREARPKQKEKHTQMNRSKLRWMQEVGGRIAV